MLHWLTVLHYYPDMTWNLIQHDLNGLMFSFFGVIHMEKVALPLEKVALLLEKVVLLSKKVALPHEKSSAATKHCVLIKCAFGPSYRPAFGQW